MARIWCISGPCGSGKTTLSAALAELLSRQQGGRQVCLLHGDDFHRALVGDERSPAALPWPQVLRFSWDCLLSVAGYALEAGLDVVIDYIVEDELPRLQQLAQAHDAALYYAVLLAPEAVLRQRLTARGDAHLTQRALFLREKLRKEPVNAGHIVCSDAQEGEILRHILALPELLQCDIDRPDADGV